MVQDRLMDQYSNSATRQALNGLQGLWRWIGESTSALVSDLAGPARDSSAYRRMIQASDDHIDIFGHQRAGGRDLIARISPVPDDLAPALRRSFKGAGRGDAALSIESSRAVTKQILLPAAALDVLPAVVRNKVESLAPWPISEVFWGYRVAGPPVAGQVAVDVGIVSRKTVEKLLGPMAEAGIKVTRLDIGGGPDGGGIGVDILEGERETSARRLLAFGVSAVAAMALVAITAGLYLAISTQQEIAAADTRVADIRQTLLGGPAKSVMTPKLTEANKLYERKEEQLPLVVVLNDLTRLVPDGVWLTDIDYSGDKITISGRGTDVSRVIEILEKSETFSNVNFASATQRDPSANTDIFSISAGIDRKERAP